MPGSSDDERDSRTAAVGVSRSQSNSSASASQTRPKNRATRKKTKNPAKKNLQDVIPRGGTFTTTPLDVDQEDATSSSESHSSNSENENANGATKPTQNKAAINWNQASRSAIRTTLGKRKTPSVPAQDKTAFDAVNDKYFRSRSASESEDEAQENQPVKISNEHQDEDDHSKTYFVYDSEGSESGEVSEGGDSVMLNIGHPSVENDTLGDSEAAALSNGSALTKDGGHAPKDSFSYRSKAAALADFTSRYKVVPAVLADLKPKDLQIQARYFFIDRNINDIDLSMPISCTECLEKGHLAFICPTKECLNCGAWDLHEDRLCPTVRRCQKCREVGHDVEDCQSLLKSSAAETPCEYCGSDTHLELDCDKLWKFPRQQPLDGPIKVSISCSYCTNKNHLLGDCPSKKVPTTSSTFSIKAYEPSTITNLNSILGPRKADQTGMRIRGRGDQPQPAQDDDNMLALHNPQAQRPQGGRGKIQIKGLGQDRSFGGGPPPLPREPPPPGPPPFQPRDYRDRGQAYNPRERSRSPKLPLKPFGVHSQGNRKPGPPPWATRGGGGGGRGRGRGRDQYRPGRP
ncbi:uncharacterized protein TRUGW13939_08473 [Talaromyces rugulosus]|uniref:CCHC-type domain-containing protein n=1 Tax=Talaromyces rugulosus TaxID=121627 RepID=A0A7H8R6V3_TALRU|nr:uncharacterized protein TRUGW13939_08473 [Talaromyces rugulosus]QKX61325.1 hypothetical protein TRUGW13939_08473 [Talaromyces rugulosus]